MFDSLPGLLCLILCLIRRSQQVENMAKCCPDSFQPRMEKNGTIICEEFPNMSHQFWSDKTNFVEENELGECADVEEENFHYYKISNSVLVSKKLLLPVVFHKCCPLKHVYNNITRSCHPTENGTITFTSQFVKVGLPDCKKRLIIDGTFKNYTEAWTKSLEFKENYCLDEDVNSEFVLRKCSAKLHSVCKFKRCFKKCCPDGQSYDSGNLCVNNFLGGFSIETFAPYIEDINDDYDIIYGVGGSRTVQMNAKDFPWNITKRGEIRYYHDYTSKFEIKPYYNFYSYCFEYNATKFNLFWRPANQSMDKYLITMPLKILSCICLLATIIVYIILGEHRTTFGKIVINYCFAVAALLTMLIIIYSRVSVRDSTSECTKEGYLLVFFNISTYTWVNLMSMYIWWTFGTLQRATGPYQRQKSFKKFLVHSLYGWGVPLFHSLVVFTFVTYHVLPESIQPHIGKFECNIENRQYSKVVFLLIPQVLFQLINIVLFVRTIEYCIRVKNEIKRINDSTTSGKFNDSKGKLALVVKLAIIMGITWTREVIVSFFEEQKIINVHLRNFEYFLDCIICLQGVFIFLVFVCKKRTFMRIINKIRFGSRDIVASATQSSQLRASRQKNN